MLLYENQVRKELEALREYAEIVRKKFDSASPEELLLDVKALGARRDRLNDVLPSEVRNFGNLGRHLAFMEHYLEKNEKRNCAGDIVDICEHDLPSIEQAFRDWFIKTSMYDQRLVNGISGLLREQHLDSAIRKSFVLLKERLVERFQVSNDLDGARLVNEIFGSGSDRVTRLSDSEKQAMRDLLAGLFGLSRNRYAHENQQPSWQEVDAVISMVNFMLHRVDEIAAGQLLS